MTNSVDRRGVVAALSAFTIWGLSPLFFKALTELGAFEVVAHRVLWSVLLLALWTAIRQGFSVLKTVLEQPRLVALLSLTTMLAAANWLVYVWAVMEGRTVEASLGYFINPLVSVALGAIFLRERLRPYQLIAVALAVTGVLLRLYALGTLPWIALILAFTFGVYGLLRKRAPVDAINGLFVETLVALPIAVAYLAWAFTHDVIHPIAGWLWWMLPLAGVITTVPLALFTVGARRLPLSVLGLLQYIAPTLQFLIAVLVFSEAFDVKQLVSFGCIWIGLVIFSYDLWRAGRQP